MGEGPRFDLCRPLQTIADSMFLVESKQYCGVQGPQVLGGGWGRAQKKLNAV